MSSLIEVESNLIDFGVCLPGAAQPPQYVGLTFDSTQIADDQEVAVTILLEDAADDGFIAQIYLMEFLVGGGAVESGAASTAGKNPSASIGPKGLGSQGVRVDFTAPLSPVPTSIADTVLLSWPGGSTWEAGSASIALTATTAELTATIESQPTDLVPGTSQTVPVKLRFETQDPTTFDVQLQQTSAPPPSDSGLHLTSNTAHLAAKYVQKSTGKFGQSQSSPIRTPVQELVTVREATVDIECSAALSTTPGTNDSVYLGVSVIDFPQLSPSPLKVRCDVSPLPLTVKVVSDEPVTVVAGESAKVRITINERGAETHFKLGAESAPSGVKLSLSSPTWSNRQALVGGGKLTVALTVEAGQDAISGATPQAETISVPWSAYGGQLRGSFDIPIRILPSAIAFVSGDLNATGATASAQWVLNNKGYWVFTGNVSNQDIFPDNYIFAMRLNVLDGNGDPIAVVQSNSVGPDLLWINNRASWDQRGFDQRVADLWPAIVSAQMRADFKASTRPFLGVIESIGIVVVAVLAIIGGGEFAAHCLNNPTVGPYRDNNGGVGVAAIFHCQ